MVETPIATPTATATASITSTPTPTEAVVLTVGRPLAISGRAGSNPVVSLHYLASQRRDGRARGAESFEMANAVQGSREAPMADIGDIGGDGQDDLVVAQAGGDSQSPRDAVEIYRIASGRAPELSEQIRAFPQSRAPGLSHLLVGDVDPTIPGAEIVVADDGSGRRSSARVSVLGGPRFDGRRPLGQFRTLRSRRAKDGSLAMALGDVLGLGAGQGQQIIVGDALGRVSVYTVLQGRTVRESRVTVFPDSPHATASRLAAGELLATHSGAAIVVGDDGTRGDGLVRVLDGRDGSIIMEFTAFPAGAAPAGVQVWVGDVIASLPGDELIVGQGAGGGTLSVFSLADGRPVHLFDIPDPLPRTSTLQRYLAIGDLLPDFSGNEIAVAQPDAGLPVQIFHLSESGALLTNEIQPADLNGESAVGCVAIGR
jgi:hypothetical protein